MGEGEPLRGGPRTTHMTESPCRLPERGDLVRPSRSPGHALASWERSPHERDVQRQPRARPPEVVLAGDRRDPARHAPMGIAPSRGGNVAGWGARRRRVGVRTGDVSHVLLLAGIAQGAVSLFGGDAGARPLTRTVPNRLLRLPFSRRVRLRVGRWVIGHRGLGLGVGSILLLPAAADDDRDGRDRDDQDREGHCKDRDAPAARAPPSPPRRGHARPGVGRYIPLRRGGLTHPPCPPRSGLAPGIT